MGSEQYGKHEQHNYTSGIHGYLHGAKKLIVELEVKAAVANNVNRRKVAARRIFRVVTVSTEKMIIERAIITYMMILPTDSIL